MRYLSEDEATRMMGLGDDVGDLYQDLDGYLYEWVEGVDEWGNSIGFLQGLSEPEIAELSGLGALYEAPDGTLYQMQGLADEEAAEAEESDESEAPKVMGPARRLPPGTRARRRLRGRPPQRHGPGVRGGPPRKKKGGFLKKLLPIAKLASKFIPIPGVQQLVTGGLTVAQKLLKKPGVAGYAGLGALYLGDDGTVYQVQGLAEENLDGLYEDVELRGLAEDDELRGFAEDEELRGFAEDQELRGFAGDEELRGFAEDEELRGLDEDEELRGLEQGYVRENVVGGMEAYVPARRPETRWFKPSTEPPELWKPLW